MFFRRYFAAYSEASYLILWLDLRGGCIIASARNTIRWTFISSIREAFISLIRGAFSKLGLPSFDEGSTGQQIIVAVKGIVSLLMNTVKPS